MNFDPRKEYLPDTVAEKYQQAVSDPELLNISKDVALIEVRLGQLLQRVDFAEDKQRIEDIFRQAKEVQIQLETENYAAAVTANAKLKDLIEKNQDDHAVWGDIFELLELRRRLVESEGNRLVRMNQMISAEDAMKLAIKLLEAVKRNVKDPNVYAAIAYEFAIATGTAHTARSPEREGEVRSGGSGVVDETPLLGAGVEGADPVR